MPKSKSKNAQVKVQDTPPDYTPTAKGKLKEFLRLLTREEKTYLWDWFDGDPNAIDELIEVVGIKNEDKNW